MREREREKRVWEAIPVDRNRSSVDDDRMPEMARFDEKLAVD